jgi:hypothetical protein
MIFEYGAIRLYAKPARKYPKTGINAWKPPVNTASKNFSRTGFFNGKSPYENDTTQASTESAKASINISMCDIRLL